MLNPAKDDHPSIYVNRDLLKNALRTAQNTASPPNSTAYRINDQVFREEGCTEDGVVEFELYARGRKAGKRMEQDYDIYCSTPTGSESSEYEDDTKSPELQITLKPVPNGYIVNGSCYLTWQQWHTVITSSTSQQLSECVLCAVYCEVDDGYSHVSTPQHVEALNMYRPLEKFDLSITRKIEKQYHCAVCNEVFALGDEVNHFSSKLHEGNLLFAINKASDILDNYGYLPNTTTKNDTYHFPTRKMDSESDFDKYDNDKYDNDKYDDSTNNANFINFQNHYEHEDFEEPEPVFTGLSYASMARKPKVEVQNYLDVDLGNKKVKVRHDSWHMVINPKLNRFWCMVCKIFDHIRRKPEHCSDSEHLKNLANCPVVEAYEEYFIRQVDDKLYHCGHCNNLQLIHEMEDHVESNHPRRTRIFSESKNDDKQAKNIMKPLKITTDSPINGSSPITPTNVKTDSNRSTPIRKTPGNDRPISLIQRPVATTNNDRAITTLNNDKQPITNLNSPLSVNDRQATANDEKPITNSVTNGLTKLNYKVPGINDTMVIYPFGYKLTILCLSYNVVCKRPTDYYCGLCDVVCQENGIVEHVYEIRHIEALQRTPFIQPFSCNLIRAVRDTLHCAICNLPIKVDNIHLHIRERAHMDALTTALSLSNKHELPIKVKIPQTKIPPNLDKELNNNVLVNKNKSQTNKNAANKSNGQTNKIKSQNNNYQVNKNGLFNKNIGHINNNNGQVKNSNYQFSNSDTQITKYAQFNNIYNDKNNVKTKEKAYNTIGIQSDDTDNDIKTSSETSRTTSVGSETCSNEEGSEEEEEEEDLDQTVDSAASEEASFDLEEYVYLKLKNSYIKIANTSYNTLVSVGDGSRYCFVCAVHVPFIELQKHVDTRSHLENMEKYRFLDKYEDHLLRQIYLMYHCSICNVIITRKELKTHLEWSTHALQNDNTSKNIKKTRKHDIKGGIKQIMVSTQKENIYLHDTETKMKICLNVAVVENIAKTIKPEAAVKVKAQNTRKNKIIIFNDNVLKFTWESWHGVCEIKNGFRCNLCQRDLKTEEISLHCASEWHRYGLDKPFEKQYAPALIRKINECTLNCLICNREVSNKEHLVLEHVNGKKHIKHYEDIQKESTQANTYADCQDDVLML